MQTSEVTVCSTTPRIFCTKERGTETLRRDELDNIAGDISGRITTEQKDFLAKGGDSKVNADIVSRGLRGDNEPLVGGRIIGLHEGHAKKHVDEIGGAGHAQSPEPDR